MTSISLPRKVFQGVAKRADMFRMFDRHIERPDRFDGDQSATMLANGSRSTRPPTRRHDTKVANLSDF